MAKDIREFISYDPETGEFLWKKSPNRNHKLEGKVPGTLHKKSGYRTIFFDGKRYLAHRLAFYIFYGRWPDELIDHINHKKTDNRICNLRECDSYQNSANRRVLNAFGKGVTRMKSSGLFRAQIMCRGKRYVLGDHKTPEAAKAAYDSAAIRLFGEFASL